MTFKKLMVMRTVFSKYSGIFLIIFCVMTGAVLQCAPGREPAKEMHQGQETDYVPGEVLVRFEEGITGEEIDKIAYLMNMKLIKTISTPDSPIYLFKLPDGLSVNWAINNLKKMPEVKHAQPNMIKRLYPVRNPPPAFLRKQEGGE